MGGKNLISSVIIFKFCMVCVTVKIYPVNLLCSASDDGGRRDIRRRGILLQSRGKLASLLARAL